MSTIKSNGETENEFPRKKLVRLIGGAMALLAVAPVFISSALASKAPDSNAVLAVGDPAADAISQAMVWFGFACIAIIICTICLIMDRLSSQKQAVAAIEVRPESP